MISKKKPTISRSIKFLIGIIAGLIALRIAENVSRMGCATMLETAVRLAKGVSPEVERKLRTESASRPCQLKRLGPEGDQIHRRDVVATECKRLEPLPNSCDQAEMLLHSQPPGTCQHQKTKIFCTLMESPAGNGIQCHPDRCGSRLFAAVTDTKTGKPQWNGFESAAALEKWITSLLHGTAKKHYGFCYIRCGEPYTDEYVDRSVNAFEDIPEDPSIGGELQLQLLVLPPSGLVQDARNAKGKKRTGGLNINIMLIDSVSHQHFYRSLPQTVSFLQKLPADKVANISVFDFQLVQAVRSRTFETLQALFSGEIDPSVKPFGTLEMPPEPLKAEHLLKALKERGYSTLWLEDLCYKWEWGLPKDLHVCNFSLSHQEIWTRFQKALHQAHIDSVEITYAMCEVLQENSVNDPFHGPEAVCMNGRYQHEYQLDYLRLYQDTMLTARQPYFSMFVTSVGHEGSGRRIQTLDSSLEKYLQHAAKQTNTLTVLFSDHGNSYGDFTQQFPDARVELYHPFILMIVPAQVAATLGKEAMKSLHTNQHRLVSILDLHYTLQAIASNFKNTLPKRHKAYNVTSRGLLDMISPNRTCSHIPRIMPNLCICQNYDSPADSDGYHVLFAHLAIGILNNEIQRQFQRISLPKGVSRAFGHCQQLHLTDFQNVMKSFSKSTVSLKMDLLVLDSQTTLDEDIIESEPQVFFVAMQATLGRMAKGSSIILQKVDRISTYGKFSECADKTVEVQLCLCDLASNNSSPLQTQLPNLDDLSVDALFLETELFVAEGTDNCLYLIQRANDHGGTFSIVNVCAGKVFQVLFDLTVSEMHVSNKLPVEETVLPGQEIFLCMAIRNSPAAKWNWSISVRHRRQNV